MPRFHVFREGKWNFYNFLIFPRTFFALNSWSFRRWQPANHKPPARHTNLRSFFFHRLSLDISSRQPTGEKYSLLTKPTHTNSISQHPLHSLSGEGKPHSNIRISSAIFIFDTRPSISSPLRTWTLFHCCKCHGGGVVRSYLDVGKNASTPPKEQPTGRKRKHGRKSSNRSIIYHCNDGGNWKYTHPFRLCHYQIYTHYK